MKLYIRNLLTALFIFCCLPSGYSTHIVGGEMFYRCLGNNQYEITLTVFRDCENGIPNFDPEAHIGIFNDSDQLVTTVGFQGVLDIIYIQDDTLSPVLFDSCLVVPPNVCVDVTTYVDTIELPFLAGGYQMVYQRCCRNHTIINLVEPDSTGATYTIDISEEAQKLCNSSPVFKEWPPIYICVNEPITFDHSAIDEEGDSLVYKLCTPYDGGENFNCDGGQTPCFSPAQPCGPIPCPPFNPPFDNVVWNPGYNVNNMLGGVPLKIDPMTGIMTGIPNTIGQFVVGVCMEEYRNGVLISTTRRDFQYNVGVCGETISSFFTPEIVCDEELTVSFDNGSQNANSFNWYFNDPTNPGFISTESNPSYTYSDSGTYTIMLVAEPGNICVDTSFRMVAVHYPSIVADYQYNIIACSDSMTIAVIDLSYDTISFPSAWQWSLSRGITVLATSDLQNPVFNVDESGPYTLDLIVTSDAGCVHSLSETFELNLVDEELENEILSICKGDSIALNALFSGEYTYQWSPDNTLSNPNSPNPLAFPTETTTYIVVISDSSGICSEEKMVIVEIPEDIELTVPPDLTTCDPNVELTAQSDQAVYYTWATDPNFFNVVGGSATALVTPIGETTYYVLVQDSVGCTKIDSVTVNGQGINVNTSETSIICHGESVQVWVSNLDPADMLTYQWTPTAQIISGANNPIAIVQPTAPGTHTFYIELENQYDCTLLDSAMVVVLDTSSQAGFISDQQCGGFEIFFTNTSINAPYYYWDFGDPTTTADFSTETNPTYTYPSVGTYTVTLTIDADVSCPDTIMLDVDITEPQLEAAFDWNFDNCTDSVTISFTDMSLNTQSTIISWLWEFSNGDSSHLQNPEIVITETGSLDVMLTIFSDDGCENVVMETIDIRLISLSLQDSVSSCFGSGVALNPNANPEYIYNWSPPDNLSDPSSGNPLANPSTTTIYSVTVTDFSFDTCQIVREVTVLVPQPITLEVSENMETCNEEVLIFAESPQAVSVEWSENPAFISIIGTTDELMVLPEFITTYYVRVTDQFGCSMTEEVVVENRGIDVLTIDQTICMGDTVRINAINLNPDPVTYSWSPIASIIEGEFTSNPLVSPDESEVYTVFLENDFGCTETATLAVTTLQAIENVVATATPDTILAGQSSQLLIEDTTGVNYQWNPESNLDDPQSNMPIASPLETTTYIVSVTGSNGCIAVAEIRVVVVTPACDEPFIFFPTGFSPNGDGENETLRVYGSGIDEAHWVIYNRWGEKVFEAFTPDMEWDGTYKGNLLEPDVFGYYLEVRCFNEETFIKKGNVTLLR